MTIILIVYQKINKQKKAIILALFLLKSYSLYISGLSYMEGGKFGGKLNFVQSSLFTTCIQMHIRILRMSAKQHVPLNLNDQNRGWQRNEFSSANIVYNPPINIPNWDGWSLPLHGRYAYAISYAWVFTLRKGINIQISKNHTVI